MKVYPVVWDTIPEASCCTSCSSPGPCTDLEGTPIFRPPTHIAQPTVPRVRGHTRHSRAHGAVDRLRPEGGRGGPRREAEGPAGRPRGRARVPVWHRELSRVGAGMNAARMCAVKATAFRASKQQGRIETAGCHVSQGCSTIQAGQIRAGGAGCTSMRRYSNSVRFRRKGCWRCRRRRPVGIRYIRGKPRKNLNRAEIS